MHINYDIDKINSILQDFSNACGINIIIVNNDFTVLCKNWHQSNQYCHAIQSTPQGRCLCASSDRTLYQKCLASGKAETHICHAGLVDVAVPLILNDEIIAYIILGQMKRNHDFSSVSSLLKDIPVDKAEMEKFYENFTIFDADRINSIANIASMVAKYIILEDVLKPENNIIIEKATSYIENNLGGDLSIENLSKRLNICRSTLYNNFESKYACTPGEYIQRKRIEKSKEYLLNTADSVESISEQVGFSSGAYFSRIFKAVVGVPPLKYRNNHKN